jgi:SPP1 family predicted phage head-tail adaptor
MAKEPNLRERLAIETQSQVAAGSGSITTAWAAVATVWGAISPLRAWEVHGAGREDGLRQWRAIVRFRADVTPKCRIVWRGRIFDVQGVRNLDEQRQYLTIELFERGA